MPDTPEQRIADAIWDELREQEIYVSAEDGMIDASGVGVNMDAVAHAVTTALGLTEEWGSMERQSQSTCRHESLGDAQRHCRMVQSNWDRNRAYQTWQTERPDLHPVQRFVTPWRNAEEEQ